MIATILAIGAIAAVSQNNNTSPVKVPCKSAPAFAAVFDQLAGHGFAGSEVIVELDWNDTRHWKAAIWLHSYKECMIPIAEQIVTPNGPEFKLLSFGQFVSKDIGEVGRATDRKAWEHAKFALPKADNLDRHSRVGFVLNLRGQGLVSDRILANREIDVRVGLVLGTFSSRGSFNFIPIGREGSVTAVLRSCLGSPEIPDFATPGFPKSPGSTEIK